MLSKQHEIYSFFLELITIISSKKKKKKSNYRHFTAVKSQLRAGGLPKLARVIKESK